MTLIASVTKKSSGDKDLVGLEITGNGVGREVFRLGNNPGQIDVTIWKEKAILLCEGFRDLTDGASEEDLTFNPLEAFLMREHPTIPFDSELRQRINTLEKENASLRQRLQDAEGIVKKIREQL